MIVDLAQAQDLKSKELQFNAYAALDATGTLEIFNRLKGRLNPDQQRTYAWSKKQLEPALAMGLRGLGVDKAKRSATIKELVRRQGVAAHAIGQMDVVTGVWDATELETGFCKAGSKTKSGKQQRHQWPRPPEKGVKLDPKTMRCLRCDVARLKPKPFEPGSSDQVKHLLYGLFGMPAQVGRTGEVTTDDEALARLAKMESPKKYKGTAELIKAIQEYRDVTKQLGFVRSPLSPDGRFHSSFNVGAPWTGRWSSSRDPFRVGGNLQNIAEQHRAIFIADAGYEMFYADLKTAESLLVAYLAGDEAYIEAHKGDVHTYVCRELWPDHPWTGDIKKDKTIAASTLPEWDNVPGHDLRFQSKRIQHGSNYGLTPFGIARIAHIPVSAAQQAQGNYFRAFPRIPEWQKAMGERVLRSEPIYNALRRVVWLMGRYWDAHTHKQALAFPPQSGVGEVLNIGLWHVWHECDPHLIQVLAQVHDAILGQYPTVLRAEALGALRTLMRVVQWVEDIDGVGRECVIPVEVAVGQNWGKFNDNEKKGALNLEGLREAA